MTKLMKYKVCLYFSMRRFISADRKITSCKHSMSTLSCIMLWSRNNGSPSQYCSSYRARLRERDGYKVSSYDELVIVDKRWIIVMRGESETSVSAKTEDVHHLRLGQD